jgi:hypothetical protein
MSSLSPPASVAMTQTLRINASVLRDQLSCIASDTTNVDLVEECINRFLRVCRHDLEVTEPPNPRDRSTGDRDLLRYLLHSR